MKKLQRLILIVAILAFFVINFAFTVFAAQSVAVEDHEITFTLPEGYVLLNEETAEDEEEIIESLGYSVSSFKAKLKPSDDSGEETFFFCFNPDGGTQISLKTWESEFSKKVEDFSMLSEEALITAARGLVRVESAEYKSVSANGMKFIEICTRSEDSGGKFCTVQYLTIRNNKFYALNFVFSGQLNDAKIEFAWDSLTALKIEDRFTESSFDVQTILMIVLIAAIIIGAIIVGVVIIISFVKDIKKSKTDNVYGSEYIERRGDPFEK